MAGAAPAVPMLCPEHHKAWRASDRPGVPLGNRRDLGANAMVCKHFGDAVGFWHSPPRAHGKVQLAIAGRNRSGAAAQASSRRPPRLRLLCMDSARPGHQTGDP